jgi:2-polyprenyl-6-methoxyphenol hydroxylase-like FAD-dependent oxidoreductase
VTAVREARDAVVATLEDGSEERGDVLVGADGFSSAVRRALHGEEPPRYAGYTAWRALVTLPAPWPRPRRALEV